MKCSIFIFAISFVAFVIFESTLSFLQLDVILVHLNGVSLKRKENLLEFLLFANKTAEYSESLQKHRQIRLECKYISLEWHRTKELHQERIQLRCQYFLKMELCNTDNGYAIQIIPIFTLKMAELFRVDLWCCKIEFKISDFFSILYNHLS